MKKAKNLNRWAYIAGLTMLLCCVASAGPTYSFVKIAGEWAFYEESDGFNSSHEVSQVGSGQAAPLADQGVMPAENGSNVSLPAVGSIINLSNSDDSAGRRGAYFLLGNSPGADQSAGRENLLADLSLGQTSVPSEAYPGASSYLVQTTLSNEGFQNPDLNNGKSQNGDSKTSNGDWGNWKNPDQDIAPVPVPVPGSIILAAIGAGLVKLLHDRRVKR